MIISSNMFKAERTHLPPRKLINLSARQALTARGKGVGEVGGGGGGGGRGVRGVEVRVGGGGKQGSENGKQGGRGWVSGRENNFEKNGFVSHAMLSPPPVPCQQNVDINHLHFGGDITSSLLPRWSGRRLDPQKWLCCGEELASA